jgi:hypothetical protein
MQTDMTLDHFFDEYFSEMFEDRFRNKCFYLDRRSKKIIVQRFCRGFDCEKELGKSCARIVEKLSRQFFKALQKNPLLLEIVRERLTPEAALFLIDNAMKMKIVPAFTFCTYNYFRKHKSSEISETMKKLCNLKPEELWKEILQGKAKEDGNSAEVLISKVRQNGLINCNDSCNNNDCRIFILLAKRGKLLLDIFGKWLFEQTTT